MTAPSRPDAPRVSLVGAGPGDPDLWTIRAARRIAAADLVLYDALVDATALRLATRAQCFSVGKRARRDSVPQPVINRLMISAARRGRRVVRLKGGDLFVFGRGGEEALALVEAGISFEVIPGVSTAIAAAEMASIPVTHRGVASAFLVMAGHTADMVENTLRSVQPNGVTVVVMMGLSVREELSRALVAQGWLSSTPAAIICAVSTPQEWVWTGELSALGTAEVPALLPGVLVVGDVVNVREALLGTRAPAADANRMDANAGDEVMYGRH